MWVFSLGKFLTFKANKQRNKPNRSELSAQPALHCYHGNRTPTTSFRLASASSRANSTFSGKKTHLKTCRKRDVTVRGSMSWFYSLAESSFLCCSCAVGLRLDASSGRRTHRCKPASTSTRKHAHAPAPLQLL